MRWITLAITYDLEKNEEILKAIVKDILDPSV